MKVTLHFDMTINIDEITEVDELGNDIATDIIGDLFNGEDVLEVKYAGHSLTS